MKRIISAIATVILAIMLAVICTACGSSDGPAKSGDKVVSSIQVTTEPSKSVYLVGETFSAEGGEITVTYEDGTTETVSLTAEGVTLTNPNMERAGNKTVTVTYGEKRTTFTVTVNAEAFTVTYELNYSGSPAANTEQVEKFELAPQPSDPVRDGYIFGGWFTDADCTNPYDFASEVEENITLYARWKEEGNYFNATFDYNYYGCNPANFVLEVKEGSTAIRPTTDPTRTGYSFAGWYADEAGASEFDFNTVFASDLTIYAKWNKTASGTETYVFEAEDTILTGKSYPGFSNTLSGVSLLGGVTGASNDRAVLYLYQQGASLEFEIASDADVDDVTFVASLGGQFASCTIDPNNYGIYVNDKKIQFSAITFTVNDFSDPVTCSDYTIAASISLKKGANTIKFVTENSDNFVGSGTIAGTAPVVDCIKLTTSAVLTWDAVKGLPADNY